MKAPPGADIGTLMVSTKKDTMRIHRILDKKTGEMLIGMYEVDDIVSVNPIKYFGDSFVVNKLLTSGVPLDELNGKNKPSKLSGEIFEKAILIWKEKLQEIINTAIPHNLISLLETTKKKDQEKLLSGLEISPMILIAYIFEAYSKFGFGFSQYRSEILPTGINKKKMPYAAEILDNGTVRVYGQSDLSQGQIKHAITHRTVMIGKFLDKGDNWHCFFANYRSLYGEEVWLGKNQPHFHYISDSFGLTRAKVVHELKSKNYKLGNVPHIKLEGM